MDRSLLINAVEKRRSLWCYSDGQRSKKELPVLWAQVAEEVLGNQSIPSVNLVKQTWTNLVTVYRRTYAKWKRDKEPVKWQYFNRMSFFSANYGPGGQIDSDGSLEESKDCLIPQPDDVLAYLDQSSYSMEVPPSPPPLPPPPRNNHNNEYNNHNLVTPPSLPPQHSHPQAALNSKRQSLKSSIVPKLEYRTTKRHRIEPQADAEPISEYVNDSDKISRNTENIINIIEGYDFIIKSFNATDMLDAIRRIHEVFGEIGKRRR